MRHKVSYVERGKVNNLVSVELTNQKPGKCRLLCHVTLCWYCACARIDQATIILVTLIDSVMLTSAIYWLVAKPSSFILWLFFFSSSYHWGVFPNVCLHLDVLILIGHIVPCWSSCLTTALCFSSINQIVRVWLAHISFAYILAYISVDCLLLSRVAGGLAFWLSQAFFYLVVCRTNFRLLTLYH